MQLCSLNLGEFVNVYNLFGISETGNISRLMALGRQKAMDDGRAGEQQVVTDLADPC